jgi:hypothetical protein
LAAHRGLRDFDIEALLTDVEARRRAIDSLADGTAWIVPWNTARLDREAEEDQLVMRKTRRGIGLTGQGLETDRLAGLPFAIHAYVHVVPTGKHGIAMSEARQVERCRAAIQQEGRIELDRTDVLRHPTMADGEPPCEHLARDGKHVPGTTAPSAGGIGHDWASVLMDR